MFKIMRYIRKGYIISCMLIGRKRVRKIILAAAVLLFAMAYKNEFNLQSTVAELVSYFPANGI